MTASLFSEAAFSAVSLWCSAILARNLARSWEADREDAPRPRSWRSCSASPPRCAAGGHRLAARLRRVWRRNFSKSVDDKSGHDAPQTEAHAVGRLLVPRLLERDARRLDAERHQEVDAVQTDSRHWLARLGLGATVRGSLHRPACGSCTLRVFVPSNAKSWPQLQ